MSYDYFEYFSKKGDTWEGISKTHFTVETYKNAIAAYNGLTVKSPIPAVVKISKVLGLGEGKQAVRAKVQFNEFTRVKYVQEGGTCAPTSVAIALTLMNNAKLTHEHLLHGIDNYMLELHRWGVALTANSTELSDKLKALWDFYNLKKSIVQNKHKNVKQTDVQNLGLVFYYVIKQTKDNGFNRSENIKFYENLQLQKSTAEDIKSFDDIFNSSSLKTLKPDEILHINWFTTGYHAFLIGRVANGTWYLYDQAGGYQFRASTAELLKDKVVLAVKQEIYKMAITNAWAEKNYPYDPVKSPLGFNEELNGNTTFVIKLKAPVSFGEYKDTITRKTVMNTLFGRIDQTLFDQTEPQDLINRGLIHEYYRADYSTDDADTMPASLVKELTKHLNQNSLFIFESTKGTYQVVKTDLVKSGHDNFKGLKVANFSWAYQVWAYLANEQKQTKLTQIKYPDEFYNKL